jgi:transposase
MQSHASTLEAAGSLDPEVSQLLAAKDKSIEELTARVEALSRQLDWFRRQMFGSKSERLVLQDNPQQISLGEIVDQGSAVAPPPKRRVVAEHTRAVSKAKDEGESLPFFDETRVPVETIELPIPEALANEA